MSSTAPNATRQGQCGMQAPGCCCRSLCHAAWNGHYDCWKLLPQNDPCEYEWVEKLMSLLRSALRCGKLDFARRLYANLRGDTAYYFMRDSVYRHDAASLRFALVTRPGMTGHHGLSTHVGMALSVSCLLVLIEHGPPFRHSGLLLAAEENRLDFLDAVLMHTREWCCMTAGVAAGAGNVRFLMHLFNAGYPMWNAAVDGEPCFEKSGPPDHGAGEFVPLGGDGAQLIPEWTLLVSSDLVRSGPVLLYAVHKGAPLTRRMRVMLGNVRRRARALARCFYKAARLSKGQGAPARKWDAMGRVPVEIIQRIATLARISIAAVDLIE